MFKFINACMVICRCTCICTCIYVRIYYNDTFLHSVNFKLYHSILLYPYIVRKCRPHGSATFWYYELKILNLKSFYNGYYHEMCVKVDGKQII